MKDVGFGEGDSHNKIVPTEKKLRQKCFVRNKGINLFDNMPQTLAVPVQRSWLRDQYTDLEILDYDPEAYVQAWPGWYGDTLTDSS